VLAFPGYKISMPRSSVHIFKLVVEEEYQYSRTLVLLHIFGVGIWDTKMQAPISVHRRISLTINLNQHKPWILLNPVTFVNIFHHVIDANG
jgi:hypothetical protein